MEMTPGWSPTADRCPKRMQLGPCGGVRADGQCEMQNQPCAFADVVQPAVDVAAVPLALVPRVLCDLSTPPFDVAALTQAAAILDAPGTALLVGEHQNQPSFPPSLTARMLRDAGAQPWLTLACRDRNRIGLEQELHGLREVGAAAVLCVTGDGRAFNVRPDVTQVFDLDGPRLASLAAQVGLSVAVPETPTAPPVARRPLRLVAKQRAGAAVAVLNHVPDPAAVAWFVGAARAAGLRIPVLAAATVFTDEQSAAVLQALPGLQLDDAVVSRVLQAPDPVAAGIAAAVAEARALLAIPGVVGVNVSGLASGRGWQYAAEVKAEVGRQVRDG